MRTTGMLLFALILFPALIGCGGSGASSGSQAGGPRPNDPVGQVAYDFWEAIRTGNAGVALGLLTPEAQKCIRENDFEFVPPASETMSFKVGAVEIVEGDQAICESIWTEVDGDGNPYHEDMSLALRLVGGEWRIFGMAASMGPGHPPMVMDLEDPSDFYGPQEANAKAQQKPSEVPQQARQPSQDPFRQ